MLKYTHKNIVFDGVDGEIQAIGAPALRSFELESFFPLKKYSFIRSKAHTFAGNGWYYVGMIERGLAAKVPFRAFYFDNEMRTIFNLPVTIDSFEYWITQSGDIGYHLSFTEYRFANPEDGELGSQAAAGVPTEAGSDAPLSNNTPAVQTDAEADQTEEQGYRAFFDNTDALYLAKTMWGEARGIASKTEIACIGWCAVNRVDSSQFQENTVKAVLTAPNQFFYKSSHGVVSDGGIDLIALAKDVLTRWSMEKSGQSNVGRVLPKEYCWYAGDGEHNYFYPAWPCVRAQRWDYRLPSPY